MPFRANKKRSTVNRNPSRARFGGEQLENRSLMTAVGFEAMELSTDDAQPVESGGDSFRYTISDNLGQPSGDGNDVVDAAAVDDLMTEEVPLIWLTTRLPRSS